MINQLINEDELSFMDVVRHNLPQRFQTAGFYVRAFAMYVIPLALAPLLRTSSLQSHCAFIVFYVLFLWLFQSIPPAIVSFLPLILAPTFLNTPTEELLLSYTSETALLYIAYALVVNSVEGSNLHKRLILTFLLVFGGKTGFIIGGFITTAIVVSMWTNAVKTTAILLPIAMEAIQHIQDNRLVHVFELRTRYLHKPDGIGTPIMEARYLIEGGIVIPDVIRILNEFFTVKKGLLIGICYSAALGSIGSVVGSGGNFFVKAFMEQLYDYRNISMFQWAQCHMPVTVLCTFLLWTVLSFCYSSDVLSSDHISKRAFEDVIYRRFAELGPITHTETVTLITLVCMSVAIAGFHQYNKSQEEDKIAEFNFEENACVFMAVMALYVVPDVRGGKVKAGRHSRHSTMRQGAKKISWAFVITMGAGICIAKLVGVYHLHEYLEYVISDKNLPNPFALQVLVACSALVLAEINNSLNSIIIFAPFIAHISDMVKVHAMYLLMPFTFCSYFGFVASTATPVSEYVADYGDLLPDEFLLPGITMKIGCTLIVLLAYNTWCWDYFNLIEPLIRAGNFTKV